LNFTNLSKWYAFVLSFYTNRAPLPSPHVNKLLPCTTSFCIPLHFVYLNDLEKPITDMDAQQSTALKSIKSLAPLLDRVLVQRIKMEAKTAGGIYLPESSVKELNEAKVLAVGPGGLDKDGKRVSCSVQVGDKVLIPQVSLIS
jgi:chaperonin GroES